jgi:hypothetical protein
MGIYIAAIVMSIVLMCAIICCFGRKYPTNLILLGAFTFCEAYMVAGICSRYSDTVVIMAGLATSLATISLTIYAMKTKTKIEVFVALAFVVYLAMLPLMIISLCVGTGALNTLYCCLGLIFFCASRTRSPYLLSIRADVELQRSVGLRRALSRRMHLDWCKGGVRPVRCACARCTGISCPAIAAISRLLLLVCLEIEGRLWQGARIRRQ